MAGLCGLACHWHSPPCLLVALDFVAAHNKRHRRNKRPSPGIEQADKAEDDKDPPDRLRHCSFSGGVISR